MRTTARLEAVALVLVLLGVMTTLGGCSTSGAVFQAETPMADRGLVYIYRESRMGGSASAFKIFVNGEHVTNMSNGGYFPYSAPPGPLKVSASIKANALNFGAGLLMVAKPEVEIDVVPGQVYYIELEFGGMSGTNLVVVDEAVGIREIEECKRTEAVES